MARYAPFEASAMIDVELPWIKWPEEFNATMRAHTVHDQELDDDDLISEDSAMIEAELPGPEEFNATVRAHTVHDRELENDVLTSGPPAMIEAELLPHEWSDSIAATLRGQSIHESELEDDDSETETFWPSAFIRTTFIAVRAAMPAIPSLTRLRGQGQPSAVQPAERTRPIYQRIEYKQVHRMVVLGDCGVGKTELCSEFLSVQPPETYDPTIIDSYRKKVVVDSISCEIHVNATAGQAEYGALRDQWIQKGEAFVLVYATTSRSSFTRVKRFYNQTQRVKESQSLLPSQHFGPSPIILIGHIFAKGHDGDDDLQSMREVSAREGAALARELGCGFLEVSTTGDGVEEAFSRLVKNLRVHQSAWSI